MINGKKYGVIDVGSNSVRAILVADGKILYRGLITSRLGEGLATSGKVSESAMLRTVDAIYSLYKELKLHGVNQAMIFGTEAARCATAEVCFGSKIKQACGLDIDIVSGDEEGEIGLLGALKGGDGGIIDIGGASAEITAAKSKKIIYSHSLPLGAVRIKDLCGEDEIKLEKTISDKIFEYGKVPIEVDYRIIGGTATTLGQVSLGLKSYCPEMIDGHTMTLENLVEIYNKLKCLTPSERAQNLFIDPKRADIILGGTYLLIKILKYAEIKKVSVSDGDNLLGYYYKKIEGDCYEK